MARFRAALLASIVAIADAVGILLLTGYAQALADTAGVCTASSADR